MNKVVLITGISSGFGKEIAGHLAKKGYTVYGSVRKKIEPTAGIQLLILDLTDNESIIKAVNSVIEIEGRIDVLINNAGMHTGGSFETTVMENAKLQIETNVIGLINITRAVLPVMRKQGEGTIVNFSSIGGLMGLPFQSFYSASKFAIEGLSEALRMELRAFNIKVVVINPGDFNTNNTVNRQKFINTDINDPYCKQFDKTLSIIEQDETCGWEPKKMASKIQKIIESTNPSHNYVVASFEQKLAVILKKILPRKLFEMMLRSHYRIN
jgi:short-subunit dehydrogenase